MPSTRSSPNLYIFFFQAEDGIRDYKVTGVQTCALPISIVESMAGMLNAGIVPVVPEYGSLRCSGDLAPLSAVALALMGVGVAVDAVGNRPNAAQALLEARIDAVTLPDRGGLAAINRIHS